MHKSRRMAALALLLPALGIAQTRPSGVTVHRADTLHIEKLATLEFPWGMALLPDGRVLVTEKPGRLRVFENGRPTSMRSDRSNRLLPVISG
jgi:glucose/arabinose dehydrogenase